MFSPSTTSFPAEKYLRSGILYSYITEPNWVNTRLEDPGRYKSQSDRVTANFAPRNRQTPVGRDDGAGEGRGGREAPGSCSATLEAEILQSLQLCFDIWS